MTKILSSVSGWANYFDSVGLSSDIAASNCEIARRQIESKVPVIFEVEHLSRLLGVQVGFFDYSLINSAENYREFEIQKRTGGARKILAPKQVLKRCQRWIAKNILDNQHVNPSACGFVKNKSVISHARVHHKSKFVLVVDVKDFFPSIEFGKVFNIFMNFGYSPNVSKALSALCCHNRVLPQGAPTSPAISNLVCRKMDKRLAGLAKVNGLRYSRYADDLAFSGKEIRTGFDLQVYEILASEGFEPNLKKTRIIQPRGQRILTGLSIGRDKIRVNREFKRRLKQEVNFVLKYGVVSHCLNRSIRSPGYLDTLIGRVGYWCSVEPDGEFPRLLFSQLLALKSVE